jgi:hypothetical protein
MWSVNVPLPLSTTVVVQLVARDVPSKSDVQPM